MNTTAPSRARRTTRSPRPTAFAAVALAAATVLAAAAVNAAGSFAGDGAPPAATIEAFRRPQSVPYPEDNQLTPARELLGRTLFFDPRLSGSNWISCASCHNPGLAWSDGLPRAIGHGMQSLDRRTPTLLNLAWAEALFWDGRADTLEQQALAPIESPLEMNLPLKHLEERLRGIQGYRELFEAAYPGRGISAETAGMAMATFERGIVSASAPFDRWIAGDAHAISASARRGFTLFTGKARCNVCHTGWRFTDDSFHDIGIDGSDLGRGRVIPMKFARFAFKTPTLRNVAERAPYMHNGSAATLMDVVELYDRGGAIARSTLSKEIKPLGLSRSEKADLVAFMLTLSSHDAPVTVPALPR